MQAGRLYKHLSQDRGLSDLTIISAFLLVPVFVGTALICLADAVYVRRARHHEHYD